MRTVLSEFCESFENELRPILDPVQQAADALAGAPEDVPAKRVLPQLRDLRHQISVLIDKVAEQQAYVLIFGPVKSGKSTFMNALSAAYVSEVTCLPAYPCMVYVSHSDEPGFKVTHYDGREATFTHRDALREVVADGHYKLTRRIREAELAGETFDPAVHMPDAIRKIDIKLDIPDLAQSGAVLVDTPGLYTRMKFGYDRMTRDFRNAAACAIFIVKTDNLFLEQVFDEFGELLELFSRIFLVVNLDSTKKDLLPDGTLAPSLEHESPWEIIEAFENLSMTAPLKEAAEDGRLSIYPVDLLRAASRRITSRRETSSGQDDGAPTKVDADFDMLLEDLTDFLNSNEYLKAFLQDSLRRSRTLIGEMKNAVEDDSVRKLAQEVESLRQSCDDARSKVEKLNRLRQIQWRDHVQGLVPWLLERVGRLATHVKAETQDPIARAIEEWFQNNDSLHQLLDRNLLPAFAAAYARLTEDAEEALKRRVSEDVSGLTATEDLLEDLKAVGLDMRETAEAALDGLKANATVASPAPILSTEQIPVRRSVGDWLLMRSGSAVRRRLFGSAERPDTEIDVAMKEARLGEPARDAIRDATMAQLDAMMEKLAEALPEQLVRGYAERFEVEIADRLEKARAAADERLETLGQRLRVMQQAHDRLRALNEKLAAARTSVDTLMERFAQTDPATLTQQVG
ncbi:MAG TPA: dynamin family protein [Gammaproteobacteria bacterium]